MQNEQNQFSNRINITKPGTITINPFYKEIYYKTVVTETSTTDEALQKNHERSVMWNYMMNLSMQNAVVQASKRSVTY